MIKEFEEIHKSLSKNENLYKGIQLYFSPLKNAEILFIGINPGVGYYKTQNKKVFRLNPLNKFEYNGQKYYLATQTKKLFQELGLSNIFSKSVKINHFPYATSNVNDLEKLLQKHKNDYKLYDLAKEFVLSTITDIKPKLIICEGKASFDRLKKYLNADVLEYNENTYVFKHNKIVVIGYKRYLSHIKDKNELKSKINQYYTQSFE